MTDPTRDLPEPPERDPAFDAAWRAASSEGPPAALDRAILAAAHRAVDAGPRRAEVREATRWERWWFPLAAAATIGAVTIGILQLVPQEHSALPDGGAIVSDVPAGAATQAERADTMKRTVPAEAPAAVPAPAPVPPAETPPPAAPATAPMRANAAREQTPRREADTAKPAPSSAPSSTPSLAPSPMPSPVPSPAPAPATAFAPSPPPPPMPSQPASAADAALPRAALRAPAAAPERLAEPFPAGTRDRQTASGGAGAMPPGAVGKLSAAPGAAARAESSSMQQATRPVDEWIALIRRLRQEGRIDEAAKELKAFRDAHRDAQALLPPDLRDWHPPASP